MASGFIAFLLGIFLWSSEESIQQKNNKLFDKIHPYCQSRGKKFTSIRKYGTDKNSNNNYSFCGDCYKTGKFTIPELTKEEFIENTNNSIKSRNWLIKKILKSKI
ncbi:MAG: zinc ribbon domain-containing protein [Lutibacter sp.]